MELSRLPAVWEAVRDDAALGDSDVRVYPYEPTPPDGVPTAAFFAPGVDVVGEEARSLSSSQWIDANAHVNQPRILVHMAGDEEIIVAKLRHELEHVVQWLSFPDGHDLFTIYDAVLVAFGSFVGADGRGSGVLYNVVPFEADANAAACALTRKLLSVSDIERLARGEHGVLFRRGPWDPDVRSVAKRSVCAASLASEQSEAFLRPQGGGSRLFGSVTGDAALWPRLCAAGELRELAGHAARLSPSPEQLAAAAPNFAAAWHPLRDALVDAINVAMKLEP